MGKQDDQQDIDELIAKTIDEIHLDALKKESDKQQLDALYQRLAALKDEQVPSLPTFNDDDTNKYMEQINRAELIDDTHHEKTLAALANANHTHLNQPKPLMSTNQGFFDSLKNALQSLLSSILNLLKSPNQSREQTNTPSKPIKSDIIPTTPKTKAREEPKPKEWRKSPPISYHNLTNLLASASAIKKILSIYKKIIKPAWQQAKKLWQNAIKKHQTHNKTNRIISQNKDYIDDLQGTHC